MTKVLYLVLKFSFNIALASKKIHFQNRSETSVTNGKYGFA